jgi:hypothetical protein
MKRNCLQNSLIGLLLLLLVTNIRADDASVTLPTGYHLVWSDEFSKDPDGLPDPTKWGYEVGFVRNHDYNSTPRIAKKTPG